MPVRMVWNDVKGCTDLPLSFLSFFYFSLSWALCQTVPAAKFCQAIFRCVTQLVQMPKFDDGFQHPAIARFGTFAKWGPVK